MRRARSVPVCVIGFVCSDELMVIFVDAVPDKTSHVISESHRYDGRIRFQTSDQSHDPSVVRRPEEVL